MDIIALNEASTANGRIEKFIENPDSASGIVTVPKTIASGETVTIPAGRVAILPNVVVDGTVNILGEVFIPSGSTYDKVIDHSVLPTATTELVSTDFVVVIDATVPKKITLTNFTQELTASSETGSGIIELATTAEAQAGTDDLRAITTLKLFNSLKGSNQNLSTNGYQKLHGGLIIQWGTQTPPGNTVVQTYNFPLAFPSYCLTFVASLGMGGNAGGSKNDATGGKYISNSQYQMGNYSGGSVIKMDWIAIGY